MPPGGGNGYSRWMRLGVLDVGSNSVHLLICDPVGGVPLPVHRAKTRLRLSERIDATRLLDADSVKRLVEAVRDATATAAEWGVEDLFAYGTAVVRDAPNRAELLDAVQDGAGVRLAVLPGVVEAELTFLAARRWMGLRAGPMALLDIGGGSLEVAFGRGSRPDFTASLPLGAGRLTRERLEKPDRPEPEAVRTLRRHVRSELRDIAGRVLREEPRTAVATSRTFQQLARLCGGPPGRLGPFVQRDLDRAALRRAVDRLACLTPDQRARLPGISAARARQSVAGAVVAHEAMKSMGFAGVTVSPWALREGLLLGQIEGGDRGRWDDLRAGHGSGDGSGAGPGAPGVREVPGAEGSEGAPKAPEVHGSQGGPGGRGAQESPGKGGRPVVLTAVTEARMPSAALP